MRFNWNLRSLQSTNAFSLIFHLETMHENKMKFSKFSTHLPNFPSSSKWCSTFSWIQKPKTSNVSKMLQKCNVRSARKPLNKQTIKTHEIHVSHIILLRIKTNLCWIINLIAYVSNVTPASTNLVNTFIKSELID